MGLTIDHDFRTLPNGPLPWEFGYVKLRTDISGDSILVEEGPQTYFYVEDEMALFKYTEQAAGGGINRRGLLASPGLLEGENADVAITFSDPTPYLVAGLDEFQVQLGIGFRGKNQLLNWVGGMFEMLWTQVGGWVTEWKISTVRVDGASITYLDSELDPAKLWTENRFVVRVKDNTLIANFNGVRQVETVNPISSGNACVLWVKAIQKVGTTITAFPLVREFQALSLRSGRIPEFQEAPTNHVEPAPNGTHFYYVPVKDLVEAGTLRQIGSGKWQFTRDEEVDLEGRWPDFAGSEGSILVAARNILPDADYVMCKFQYK